MHCEKTILRAASQGHLRILNKDQILQASGEQPLGYRVVLPLRWERKNRKSQGKE